jgi:ketosteroid isomerase-like protein
MSKNIIDAFYTAFAQKDWQTMQSYYHDDTTFSDEVFKNLNSKQVKAMWRMLCEGGKDLQLRYENVEASETQGKCRWIADYTFSQTGNKVNNIIDASFTFKDGKILAHHDVFDFYRWSRQALGFKGWLLGWTPFVKQKIQKVAMQRLQKFIEKTI